MHPTADESDGMRGMLPLQVSLPDDLLMTLSNRTRNGILIVRTLDTAHPACIPEHEIS